MPTVNHMTDPQACATPSEPATPAPPNASDADRIAESLRLGSMDARARICFRITALCLAALVLIVITVGLHTSTQAFFEVARLAVLTDEPLRAMPVGAIPVADGVPVAPPDGASWPHGAVAVVTALLVGDVVLAIGLIRATFSLTVDSDKGATPAKDPISDSFGLPGAELLKATKDAIATVTKDLPPR